MRAMMLGMILLAGCGPVSPEAAARMCTERARAADGPTGKVEVGVGNRGVSTGLSLGITSDYLNGRDPYEVYDSCVRQKSGQGPIRPLVL